MTILYKIHFDEHDDEDLFLSENECEEWLDELKCIIEDKQKCAARRLQEVVDNVIG